MILIAYSQCRKCFHLIPNMNTSDQKYTSQLEHPNEPYSYVEITHINYFNKPCKMNTNSTIKIIVAMRYFMKLTCKSKQCMLSNLNGPLLGMLNKPIASYLSIFPEAKLQSAAVAYLRS